MATADGKLNVSELDFEKIKENLIGFMSNQAEFVGYNFKGSSFDILLIYWHIIHTIMHIMLI